MPIDHPPASRHSPDPTALGLVLRHARSLHRAARSVSLAASLPVLRRLLAAGAFADAPLTRLHDRRQEVQRKHVLRMLAAEAGHRSWEDYRRRLPSLAPGQLQHFDMLRRRAPYPNLWFSSMEDAQRHAAAHGGRALRVGAQAVVLDQAPDTGAMAQA